MRGFFELQFKLVKGNSKFKITFITIILLTTKYFITSMESKITFEERMNNNPTTLKNITKEFEKLWGKDTPFQYIDDEGTLEQDVSKMSESKIISLVNDSNIFDIYGEADDSFATCNKCNKIESPSEDDEYGSETGIYNCNPCKEKIKIEKYFSHLKSQGVLKDNLNWIKKVYPHLKKYIK